MRKTQFDIDSPLRGTTLISKHHKQILIPVLGEPKIPKPPLKGKKQCGYCILLLNTYSFCLQFYILHVNHVPYIIKIQEQD